MCKPITLSINKSVYMIISVNKATCMIFADFHKAKTMISQTIYDIITWINIQKGDKITKQIYSDNNSEFGSAEFDRWFKDRKIKHTLSVLHILEHNSIAEQAIQTVIGSLHAYQ